MSETILITRDQIDWRTAEMCREIANDLRGKKVVFIGILKGAIFFMCDLIRGINLPAEDVETDFMQVQSYGNSQESSGVVTITKEPTIEMAGKTVVIVEDIIDTGLTMREVVKYIKSRGPAEVKVATFLDKPKTRKVEFRADYVGFTIEPQFVVGYGLDFAEKYRTVPEVRVLDND